MGMVPTNRTKKYERKDPPPGGHRDDDAFKPDDYKIISIAARHGAVDTRQLTRFFPHRSEDGLKRRVTLLFHHGFLARPRAQEHRNRLVKGSTPLVVTPDRRGIRNHRARERDPVPMPKWTHDNDKRTWGSINHLLTTTDLRIAYQFPETPPKNFAFTPGHELLLARGSERTLKAKAPYKLSTNAIWPILNRREVIEPTKLWVSTEPDDYFSVTSDRENFYFHESDEGTEIILPNKEKRHSLLFFHLTSLLQKYAVYANAFRERVHEKHFGIPNFRVITTTSTPARVQKIIRQCYPFICEGDRKVRPGLFLFTDRETLAKHGNNPYAVPHLTMAGEEVMLID